MPHVEHHPAALESSLLAVDRYRLLRGQIEHEDNLITQRLSWFLASQAFLFSALAIVMNAPPQPRFGQAEVAMFHRLIPLIAIAVGLLIWLAIWAGVLAMARLRAMIDGHPELADFPQIQGMHRTRWMGLAAPLWLPPMFVAVWCLLLSVG
jgi:hypothetical protein